MCILHCGEMTFESIMAHNRTWAEDTGFDAAIQERDHMDASRCS